VPLGADQRDAAVEPGGAQGLGRPDAGQAGSDDGEYCGVQRKLLNA
jgi:hypothetical protein